MHGEIAEVGAEGKEPEACAVGPQETAVTPEERDTLGGSPVHGQTFGIATVGWSLTHEIHCFGWWQQQPRGEPRRMPRALGLFPLLLF